jgi:hypothetical protein
MQSFSRGWSFLKQARSMPIKDWDLLKPSIYALIVGMVIAVIGIIPIAVAAVLLGDSSIGNIILFVMCAGLIFFTFVMVASVISSYTTTAYHTCLYIRACDVEQAQAAGQSYQVAAPAPLAAVLS